MKVLVISGAFPPVRFAEAGHTLQLCQHIAQRGIDVHLLTTQGAVSKNLPFTVHPIMRDWSWTDLPRFVRFVRQCSPSAVLMVYIGFIYNDHPMATFAPTICKFALPGIPFVVQFENVMGAPLGRCGFGNWIVREALRQWVGKEGVDYEFGTLLRDSDGLITLCGEHGARLRHLHPSAAQKCVFIPPPPTVPVFENGTGGARQRGRELLNLGPDEFVFMYFGYIYPSKGLETLLKAFHLVKNSGSRARLVIAGGVPAHLHAERLSYLEQLKELATTLGRDDIVWTGDWDWETDLSSLYLHAADVCILPFDGGVSMNNSTVAAAAVHGLPIISTRGTILEPFFHNGENIFLCDPQNPQNLAVAIQTVMDQKQLRTRLGLGAHKLSQEWFSWDKAVERTLETLLPSP